jgi:hypothetical protein
VGQPAQSASSSGGSFHKTFFFCHWRSGIISQSIRPRKNFTLVKNMRLLFFGQFHQPFLAQFTLLAV